MIMTIPMSIAEIVLSLFMTGVLGVLAKFLNLILKPEDDGLLRAVPGILARCLVAMLAGIVVFKLPMAILMSNLINQRKR